MPNYFEWNDVITDYFTQGVPKGSTIFLSVDDASLTDIALRYFRGKLAPENAVNDFLNAIREQCVKNETIDLTAISGLDGRDIPRSIAFLSTMVLAAYQMADDIEASDNNYFIRLRDVLGLPHEDGGRPRGLKPAGVEESLWKEWNRLLLKNDWLHSAQKGQHENTKYIYYPLSQALLREGDKEKLEKLFREHEKNRTLRRNLDEEQLIAWLRSKALPSSHLRELMAETDAQRMKAIRSAIYELYETIDWKLESTSSTSFRTATVQRRLIAGLYRSEDPIMAVIKYKIFPPLPKRFHNEKLQVVHGEQTQILSKFRDGWYMPLWEEPLSSSASYKIEGSLTIEEIVMPERHFWILKPDPENPDSNVFASWGSLELDTPFLLVCQKDYAEQLQILKGEELLDWRSERSFYNNGEEWIEYSNCIVSPFDWEGISPIKADLCDALKPVIATSISLTGGLRVPNQASWLVGYQPQIIVISQIADLLTLKVFDVETEDVHTILEDVQTNVVISDFPRLAKGNYVLRIYDSEDDKQYITQRHLRLSDWSELQISLPNQSNSVRVGEFEIEGGIIRAVSHSIQGNL